MIFFIVVIILICFIYFLPRILGWLMTFYIKRKLKKAYGQTARNARDARDAQQRQQPRRASKKIDPTVGEYVHFEEVSVFRSETVESSQVDSSHDSSSSRKSTVTVEEQIVDVEWEDLPPQK